MVKASFGMTAYLLSKTNRMNSEGAGCERVFERVNSIDSMPFLLATSVTVSCDEAADYFFAAGSEPVLFSDPLAPVLWPSEDFDSEVPPEDAPLPPASLLPPLRA